MNATHEDILSGFYTPTADPTKEIVDDRAVIALKDVLSEILLNAGCDRGMRTTAFCKPGFVFHVAHTFGTKTLHVRDARTHAPIEDVCRYANALRAESIPIEFWTQLGVQPAEIIIPLERRIGGAE
jgi:hypothetical protein